MEGLPLGELSEDAADKQADCPLRICKGASKDTGEHLAWCLTSSTRSLGFVPVLGGWILDSISWWCKHGASHRKKCGHVTPKLGTAERQRGLWCLRRLTFAASTKFVSAA